MIARPDYINMLLGWRDKRAIKILTGIRRCGKSTLMEMYRQELLDSGVLPEQIQSYNLEHDFNEDLRNASVLYKQIYEKRVLNKKNYVFLDEIQAVPNFGTAVNSLYIDGCFDIYITGSNSKTLPLHIANSITREYVTLKIFPLSFKEYYTARRKVDDKTRDDKVFEDYLTCSSMPIIFNYFAQNEFDLPKIRNYLNDLLYKIIYHDIVEEKKITDQSRFDEVLKFMLDNISKETSIKNIAKTMTSKGMKTDPKTIESYLEALCDNFLFYRVDNYGIKGKYRFSPNYKYYLADIGLRNTLLSDSTPDRGKILENIVYLELLRRNFKVFVGKHGNKEIDFVVQTLDGLEYYQVAQTIVGEETFKREFTPLNSIKDHYPKYILTEDVRNAQENGIKIKDIMSWLLK